MMRPRVCLLALLLAVLTSHPAAAFEGVALADGSGDVRGYAAFAGPETGTTMPAETYRYVDVVAASSSVADGVMRVEVHLRDLEELIAVQLSPVAAVTYAFCYATEDGDLCLTAGLYVVGASGTWTFELVAADGSSHPISGWVEFYENTVHLEAPVELLPIGGLRDPFAYAWSCWPAYPLYLYDRTA